jgi:phosphate transport system protein
MRFDNHAFPGFDAALTELLGAQQSMGETVDAMLALLQKSIADLDAKHFDEAKQIDKNINDAELAAEWLALDTIAKFSGAGEDLRFVIGSIKVMSILERIADKVKNCIKRSGRISQTPPDYVMGDVVEEINAVKAMVPLALAQLAEFKDATARELLQHGAGVQSSFRQTVVKLNQQRSNELDAADDTHLLLIAKNLEQAADMAVEIMKICHHIHFGTKFDKASAA